jgi:hypothetical protein
MRASDEDRERVVAALQEQVGEGRLTLDEFEQRSRDVYEAKTIADLRDIVKDLPVNLFPEARQQVPPWQQPFPLPVTPPWHQRPNSRQMAVRRNPMLVGIMAIAALIIVVNVVGFLAGAALHFVLPVFLIGCILMRVAGVGGRRFPPRPPRR